MAKHVFCIYLHNKLNILSVINFLSVYIKQFLDRSLVNLSPKKYLLDVFWDLLCRSIYILIFIILCRCKLYIK